MLARGGSVRPEASRTAEPTTRYWRSRSSPTTSWTAAKARRLEAAKLFPRNFHLGKLKLLRKVIRLAHSGRSGGSDRDAPPFKDLHHTTLVCYRHQRPPTRIHPNADGCALHV